MGTSCKIVRMNLTAVVDVLPNKTLSSSVSLLTNVFVTLQASSTLIVFPNTTRCQVQHL